MNENNIITMDRAKLIDFLKKNLDYVGESSNDNEFIEGILKLIPLLNNYEEESQKIRFKLAVGMRKNVEKLAGRFHVLQKYEYQSNDSQKIQDKVVSIIKKVIIFCSRDAEAFIIFNESSIDCGVYFTDLEKTGDTEQTLLKNKFIVFEQIQNNKIFAQAEVNSEIICFDFDDEKINTNICKNNNLHKNIICKTWDGIFEKIKKRVHGTICLFVDDEWQPGDDKNFTGEINEVNINLSRGDNSSADGFQDFENKIELFLSMLNYDGITIVDTKGNIRAYNMFCKISNDEKITNGGARHRAYEFLKNLSKDNCKGYVAIYFQSQEGEIKFHIFNGKSEESSFFDSEIMNYLDKTNLELIKNIQNKKAENLQSKINETESSTKYNNIINKIQELKDAHEGIDNFYNEPSPAKKLQELLSNNENMEIVKKDENIVKFLINTVIECILGNSYGYSIEAQQPLIDIIKLIDSEIWTSYFENYDYIEEDLVWCLSNEKLYIRWKSIILKIIFEKYPDVEKYYSDKFTSKTFKDLYFQILECNKNNVIVGDYKDIFDKGKGEELNGKEEK